METIRIRVAGADALQREIAAAEAWDHGALGIVEEADAFWVHAPAPAAGGLRAALSSCDGDLRVGPAEPVVDQDWSERWKEGLLPLEVSPRLVVCPSFVSHAPAVGQRRLDIDPGQAFGTGGHGSTWLALGWVDALDSLRRGGRLLDVGCGTGVLALAGVALGARHAVACDLDPLATEATRENAAANGLGRNVEVFTGSLAALAPAPFECVVANMIRHELMPILPALALHVARGGDLVLSGLLAAEEARMRTALAGLGLVVEGRTSLLDERGDDWLALHAARP